MSIRLMSAAWEVALADSDKLVLLALADWSGDDGVCWPSIAKLANKCSKSERTIQMSIQRLVAAGQITRSEVRGRGCKYIVHPQMTLAEIAPPQPLHPRRDCTPAANGGGPPQPLRGTPAAVAPNTLLKHQDTLIRRATRARRKSVFELPDWVPAEAWAAFDEMRRAMHRAFTDPAKKAVIEDLEKLKDQGHDPGACLMLSVINGYRRVYPPNGSGAATPSGKPISDIDRLLIDNFARLQAGTISDGEFEAERARLDLLERERIAACGRQVSHA